MKTRYPKEFLFSLGSLLAATIVIHAIWTAWVRPNAQAVLAVQAESMRKDPNYVPQRSMFVIMKDWEQESCVILMIWALAIIVFKNRATRREQELLEGDPVRVPEGMRILPEDTREYVRQLESLPAEQQQSLIVRASKAALARFGATRNVQDVSRGWPRRLRGRGRAARFGALDDPLYRLGDPGDRLHRHGARHRRRARRSAQGRHRRHLGRHRGPRRRVQFDARRAAAVAAC